MATHASRRRFALRAVVLIGACTVLLTASFVGVLSVLSGGPTNLAGRLPWYLVVSAAGFAVTIIALEDRGTPGRTILATAVAAAVSTFVLLALGIEGFLFAYRNPEEVLVSRLLLYFVAAGLLGTGFGYWGLNHWREVTGEGDRL